MPLESKPRGLPNNSVYQKVLGNKLAQKSINCSLLLGGMSSESLHFPLDALPCGCWGKQLKSLNVLLK